MRLCVYRRSRRFHRHLLPHARSTLKTRFPRIGLPQIHTNSQLIEISSSILKVKSGKSIIGKIEKNACYCYFRDGLLMAKANFAKGEWIRIYNASHIYLQSSQYFFISLEWTILLTEIVPWNWRESQIKWTCVWNLAFSQCE